MAGATVLRYTGRKGLVFVSPNESSPPTIKVGDKTFTAHRPAPGEGTYKGDSGYQFIFPSELQDYLGQDAELSYGGKSQGVNLDPQQEFRADGGGIGDMHAAPNKDLGGGGAYGASVVGGFGAVPANILAEFPDATHAEYEAIKAAKYNFTDPFKFAEKFGAFNRTEYEKNFNQSQDLALRSLETELQGLTEFIPAMSALKRQETSIDNQFNQQERTNQLNTALPGFVEGVNEDLSGQRGRANAFASGRIPDENQDRAFELGIRSASADRSAAGGFGARSSVARKASDLMSAEERVKLSQYGDSLLGQNVNARTNFANFQLAPLEYANAGSQINVNPSVSVSQLTSSYANAISAFSGLTTGQAIGVQTQQEQFKTGLEQTTNQFNASNKLNLSMFNAGVDNQFALTKFGYKAGYASSVAAATQTGLNTQFGLDQQNAYNEMLEKYMGKSQDSGLLNSLFSGGAALFGSGGLSGLTGKGGSGASTSTNPYGSYGGPDANSAASAASALSGAKGSGLGSSLEDLFGGGLDKVGKALGGIF